MRFHCGRFGYREALYIAKSMCHTAVVSCRIARLLLWIERRIARLRHFIDTPSPRQGICRPTPDLFDRRDLRAKW